MSKIISLGIDQGLANCGYGVLEFTLTKTNKIKSIKILEVGLLTTTAKKNLEHRLLYLEQKIEDVIKKYKPNVISCEKLFYTPNRKGMRNKSSTIVNTNMVSGIIYLLAGKYNIFIKDFVPSSIKKTITGNGKAQKEDMIDSIHTILKVEKETINNEHKADSLCIGYTAGIYYINIIKED